MIVFIPQNGQFGAKSVVRHLSFSLRNRGGWGEDGDGGHERRVRGYAYGRQLVGRCVRREGAHGVRGYAYGRQLVGRCVRQEGAHGVRGDTDEIFRALRRYLPSSLCNIVSRVGEKL